ncbi:MAG TPA: protein kinase [Myxococcaceae bacterium]|nr:protein kinase [Myxococcaceae bacterium]
MESAASAAQEPLLNHRYRVVRQLGTGAMGEVFLVQDTLEENQLQALKTIRREFVTSYGYSAFKNEFQAMTAFHHPNVVEVYEFGTVAGTQDDFFTMEYVEGKNLLAAGKAADLETIYDYAVQIARALEYIHAQGFIHFDLKPDNIMVREDGTVKVMDFGLVEQSSIGNPGVLKGTVHYLAPEMLRGDAVDPRLDLYSLGAVLYHVITGRTLFEGTVEQVMYHHLQDEPDLNAAAPRALPDALKPLLRRLLDKDPAKRPASAGELLTALHLAVGASKPPQAREVSESYILGSRSVGRGAELNRLQELFVQRVLDPKPGAPSVVLVTGTSGTGRSRLMQELRHQVQLRRVRYHQGTCLQNGGQPYLPFAEVLRAMARDILPSRGGSLPRSGGTDAAAYGSGVAPGPDADSQPGHISSMTGAGQRGAVDLKETVLGPRPGADSTAPPPVDAEEKEPGTLIFGRAIQLVNEVESTAGTSRPGTGTVMFGIGSSDLAHLGGSDPSATPTPIPSVAADGMEPPDAPEQLAQTLLTHAPALARLLGAEYGLAELAAMVETPKFSSPDRERAWLQDNICRFILSVAKIRPQVLYVADLHWADASSLDLLVQLSKALAEADKAGGTPVRLLLASDYRVEELAGNALEKPVSDLGKDKLSETIKLKPLTSEDVGAMLGSMLGPVDQVESVARLLAERTSGNPFFIEAAVRNLLEEGGLKRHGATWAFSPDALKTAATSVQQVLDRTLAKMPADELDLIQALAVFNRPVNIPVLMAAGAEDEKALRKLLTRVRRKRFLARGWAEGHHQYSLRHATLRDHVHTRIPAPRRGALHEAAGVALERRYPGSDRYLEDLAHHFQISGNADKAIHYARKAADQARRLFDMKRASQLYSQAHEALQLLGADLAVSIAEVSLYAASEKHVERLKAALPKVEEIKDVVRLARIQNWMGRMYYALGKQRDAIQWFTQFMKTTEGTKDDVTRALPHAVLGRVSFFVGKFETATKHLEKSISLLRGHVGAEEDISYSLGMGGAAYGYLGDLPKCRKMIEESIDLATQINNKTRMALGRVYLGIVNAHYGRWPEAREHLDRGIEISKQTGDVIGAGTGSSFRGLVALAEGDATRALELCRFGRDHIAKTGGTMTFTMIGTHTAMAQLLSGEVDAALKTARETLPILETGERWGESCLYVTLGHIHAKRREMNEARGWFQKALAVAEAQKGKPFEAKARLALGAFLRDAGESHGMEELSKARALFDQLKMGWYRDRAEALLDGEQVGPLA